MSHSLREYARHRAEAALPGRSLASVRKAARTGRIELSNGKVEDFEEADRQWAWNTSALRRPKCKPEETAREARMQEQETMEDTTATEAETPIYTRTELKSAMNFAVVRTLNALRSRYCFELMAAGLLKTGASVEGAQRFLKWLDEFISIGVEPEEGVIGVARAARIDWAMLKRERGRGTFSREQWELWTALTCQRFKPEEEGKS